MLLGILPLHSQRHAEFLHNEVPGITIPAEIRAAMGGAGDRAAEVGLDIAHALLAEVADQVQGTYVMPSFGRYELAGELVRRIRADCEIRAVRLRANDAPTCSDSLPTDRGCCASPRSRSSR